MERENAFNTIAAILRIPAGDLYTLDSAMIKATGHGTVVEDLAAENAKRVLLIRNMFGLSKNATAEQASGVLLDALRQSDAELHELFHKPDGTTAEGLRSVFNFCIEFAAPARGFFLNHEKAKELLYLHPPLNVLSSLGYASVKELLQKEDLYQVFAALRIVEGSDWLNGTFFKGYASLTQSDFETRPIGMIVLDGKWMALAKKFQKKKYHSVSHLKEMGIVYVIPERIDTPGETMRLYALLSHYVHEVSFYASLIRKYSYQQNFPERLVSMCRGDVPQGALNEAQGRSVWHIVQRYLAKEDPNHPMLFTPHVNPEALHWWKTEREIARLNDRFPFINVGFWYNLDFVGEFFRSEKAGTAELVSFDLLDNIMALVMEKHLAKYLYHQQEAMWNKLFSAYMGGEEVLERLLIENFDRQAIVV